MGRPTIFSEPMTPLQRQQRRRKLLKANRTRSGHQKSPLDFYRTPGEAVEALAPFLKPATRFAEPCAGAADLIRHLEALGHTCSLAIDLAPRHPSVRQGDALALRKEQLGGATCIVTNLPFAWKLFRPLVLHLMGLAPLWTLMPGAFVFNAQCKPLLDHAVEIIPTKRLRLFAGTRDQWTKDTCWCLFDAAHHGGPHLTPRPKG